MVLWFSLQCVIVVFPDHSHLLLHVKCEGGNHSFLICLDVPVCASTHSHRKLQVGTALDW